MENATTLKTLVSLAIEHDVDFEIYHGETTHSDKRVRAQMLISLKDCPEVRVLFGDKQHGQRLSSISLASNSKINVKKEHLLTAIEQNSTNSEWHRVMDRESNLINLTPAANNGIKVTGKTTGNPKLITDETGSWHEYEIIIENHALNTITQQVIKTEPTRFHANIPVTPGTTPAYKEGTELELSGDYIFPDHINVHSLTQMD
jgi:hypothetical protein